MLARRIVMVAFVSAWVVAGTAHASSPFTGTWQGDETLVDGPYTCTPPLPGTYNPCTVSRSWSGTVDADGIFKLVFGAGRRDCTNGSSSGVAADGRVYTTPIPASGSNRIFQWCDNCVLYLNFSASPSLSVRGSLANCSCTMPPEPDGRVCTATLQQATITGSGTPPASPPPFPMTVSANIGSTTSSATANIQFRPQDVGTSGSVYVFAMGPATLAKDTPASCVLAQLDGAGRLQPVSGPNLQASVSGILSAQGQSVEILRSVPTPGIAGATFYVGYGSSAGAMFDEGIYRSAVTVPGGSACPLPSSQTALFWNPAESGWGLNLNHQGNILFGTLFTYDATHMPLWLVLSNGAMLADGASYAGDLFQTTGPPFHAVPFTPITAANLTRVGAMTVTFFDLNSGSLRYTVNGVEVTKAIQRQVFGARASACLPSTQSRVSSTNYQDLWWNASESGWGINLTHQGDTLFATLFTYGADGKGLWLVMSSGTKQPDGSYLGDLYRTRGPAFDAQPFTPIGSADITKVGTMQIRFGDGDHGTLTYSVDGTQVTKAITRQVFSSPLPACY